jgi:hypothetical protein
VVYQVRDPDSRVEEDVDVVLVVVDAHEPWADAVMFVVPEGI